MRALSNPFGVDDAPFARAHRGDVSIVGTALTRHRLGGVLVGAVRRDRANATDRVAARLEGSPFRDHVQAVLLDGIALAGLDVIDLCGLAERLARPVLALTREASDLAAIRRAREARVPGGARDGRRIERAGPMEPIEGVWVRRAGLRAAAAARLLGDARVQGLLPDPIRLAPLITGALARGRSRGGA